jgi:hypothetical protein
MLHHDIVAARQREHAIEIAAPSFSRGW